MSGKIQAALLLALPLLMTRTALAGDGVQLKITNDGTQDIVVTVYDMNAKPRAILLQNARINGFTSVPLSAIADSTGRANLAWTATTVDPNSVKCGHADTLGLRNDSAVHVHADSSCNA
jgi:O-succinylbenzoate synthase